MVRYATEYVSTFPDGNTNAFRERYLTMLASLLNSSDADPIVLVLVRPGSVLVYISYGAEAEQMAMHRELCSDPSSFDVTWETIQDSHRVTVEMVAVVVASPQLADVCEQFTPSAAPPSAHVQPTLPTSSPTSAPTPTQPPTELADDGDGASGDASGDLGSGDGANHDGSAVWCDPCEREVDEADVDVCAFFRDTGQCTTSAGQCQQSCCTAPPVRCDRSDLANPTAGSMATPTATQSTRRSTTLVTISTTTGSSAEVAADASIAVAAPPPLSPPTAAPTSAIGRSTKSSAKDSAASVGLFGLFLVVVLCGGGLYGVGQCHAQKRKRKARANAISPEQRLEPVAALPNDSNSAVDYPSAAPWASHAGVNSSASFSVPLENGVQSTMETVDHRLFPRPRPRPRPGRRLQRPTRSSPVAPTVSNTSFQPHWHPPGQQPQQSLWVRGPAGSGRGLSLFYRSTVQGSPPPTGLGSPSALPPLTPRPSVQLQGMPQWQQPLAPMSEASWCQQHRPSLDLPPTATVLSAFERLSPTVRAAWWPTTRWTPPGFNAELARQVSSA